MKVPAIFVAALLAVGAVFLLAPEIDLATSRLFYDPHAGFVLETWFPVRFIERSVPLISWGIGILVAIGAVALLCSRQIWRLDARALVFITLATALGPGLLVNTVLKDHWGRARPAQVEEFGGPLSFTPAPLISHQCPKNCSFVSGHAALGFSLVSFAFLLPAGRRRRIAVLAALGFGAIVGLARIAGGRHFLSDVIDAGFLVTAVSWLLYQSIVAHDWFGPRSAIVAGFALFEGASTLWLDRPLALYLHQAAAPVEPTFATIARLGLGYPYLVFFGGLFVVMRWGGALPMLRAQDAAMRTLASAPGFLFAVVAVSGLAVDAIKVVAGRTRPKLLFAANIDHFTGLAFRADHWSFPSGHATTAAALMLGLWYLWPRPAPVYAAIAVLIAAARVIICAHYLSDVVAGLAIGATTTWLIAGTLARRGYAFDGGSLRVMP
jgi:lipid A 4'-phosphatase